MAITPEQKIIRKKGLFSSDIARIMCGHSVSVALDKLGTEDSFDALEDLAEIRLGKYTEPFILDAYDNLKGCKVERSLDTIYHPEIPFIGVHLDARYSPKRNVEAKTCGGYNIHLYGEPGTDLVPDYNLWQAHAGMACTGAMETEIAVCFLNLEATRSIILGEPPPVFIYRVERDYVLEDAMIKKVSHVWDCIQRGETPEPENLSDLKLIYSRASDHEVTATPEIYTKWVILSQLKALEKEVGELIEKQAFDIQKYMKDAAGLRVPDEGMNSITASMELRAKGGQLLATWKNDSDSERLDIKTLRDEQEEIYKHYLVPRPGPRKFLLKKDKKEKG